ncbi:MAG: hypothetical protein R3F39_09660 [Myxococcota bacterium]
MSQSLLASATLALILGASACGDSGGSGSADGVLDTSEVSDSVVDTTDSADSEVLQEIDVAPECTIDSQCGQLVVGACERAACEDNVCVTKPSGDPCCGDAKPARPPGAFGSPCSSGSDCFSGFCVPSPDDSLCGRACQDLSGCSGCSTTCGVTTCVMTGMSCKRVMTGDDPLFTCVFDDVLLCAPCTSDAECHLLIPPGQNLCIPTDPTAGPAGWCARRCDETEDSPCPPDYTCQDVPNAPAGAERQCIPTSGSCAP